MKTMANETALRNGYRIAQAIAKHYAKTFYFSSFFLPTEKKFASYCLYALLRICDESVDAPLQRQNPKALDEVKRTIDALYGRNAFQDSLLLACKKTIDDYKIPKSYFYELLEGMQMDRSKTRYNNFAELYDYCYKVAGVVGLIMLKVLSPGNAPAEKHAVSLGIAMQLANILRDIKEDLQRGRIYLPRDEMERFSVTEASLETGLADDNFKAFMQFQIQRSREYFDASGSGIKMLKGPRIRLCVSAMKEIYAKILRAIEQNKYDVFSARCHVSFYQKLASLPAILKGT